MTPAEYHKILEEFEKLFKDHRERDCKPFRNSNGRLRNYFEKGPQYSYISECSCGLVDYGPDFWIDEETKNI
jgi:hypothetical protein